MEGDLLGLGFPDLLGQSGHFGPAFQAIRPTAPAPWRTAVRATSMATLPPPITTTPRRAGRRARGPPGAKVHAGHNARGSLAFNAQTAPALGADGQIKAS